VLHHLVKSGHTLESDNQNTEAATNMLHRLASEKDVKTHIEDGKGKVIPHEGDISSEVNRKKYITHFDDPSFLNDTKHKHVLVFSKR